MKDNEWETNDVTDRSDPDDQNEKNNPSPSAATEETFKKYDEMYSSTVVTASSSDAATANTPPPFVKPKFIAKKTGWFYSIASVIVQLGAVAVVVIASIVLAFLPLEESVSETILNYLTVSTQLLLAGCVIFYMLSHKATLKDMNVKKVAPLDFLMAILLGLGVIVLVNPIEGIFSSFLELLGYQAPSSVGEEFNMEGGLVVLAFFCLAILPAVFEELTMRSIVLNGTKECSTAFRVLMNGLLFSLFHANPSQTGYTFVMGCAFAFIAIRCDSVIPTMVLHCLNNGLSVMLMYFGVSEIPETVAFVALGIAIAFTAIGSFYFLKKNRNGETKQIVHRKPFVKGCLLGIIFNAALWLIIFLEYNVYLNPTLGGM